MALLLLAVAMVLSLVLGLGVAWARGVALVRAPSWWAAPMASHTGQIVSVAPPDGRASAAADTAVSPSPSVP